MPRLISKLLAVSFAVFSIAHAEGSLYLQPGALDFIGIYDLRGIDPNLNGQDVNVAVISRSVTYEDGFPLNDFAVNSGHPCFLNSEINQYSFADVNVSVSEHATAVASIIAGDNSGKISYLPGEFYYEGAAPKCRLDVYEFWYFLQNHIYKSENVDADVVSISSGSTYEDWWTRGFERIAQSGVVVVAGIGNGTNADDPVLYPGGSANTIGVGVAESVIDPNISVMLSNFGLPRTENSSFGPASRKRCKPDIVAPGNCIVADVNDSFRLSGNYSSFATPVVSGTAALLVEKIKEDFNDVVPFSFRGMLVKSVLLNSADKLPYWHKGYPGEEDDHTVALDYVQGAGMVDAFGAAETLDSKRWSIAEINGGEVFDVNFTIDDPNGEFITATLTFNYKFEDSYPYNLVKAPDLRLELWGLDANDPAKDVLIDYSDCPSGTVEHIYVQADGSFKNYLLRVSSDDLESEELTGFALSWEVENRTEANEILYYDLNNDGVVDDQDFILLINNFGKPAQSKKGYRLGDLDYNGKIETEDLKVLMTKKGQKAYWKSKPDDLSVVN